MWGQLTRCAKKIFSRLASAAHELFCRITQPPRPNLGTGTLADLPRSRTELLAENALWRQQLVVLYRRTKTPRLTWRERLSLLCLARWVPHGQHALPIIKPDTRLRWPRAGFRLFGKFKLRVQVQSQPQRLPPETIALIQWMAREHPLWGAARIRGEWRTIQQYMQQVRSQPPTGQGGSTCLPTHGKDSWAGDCVPVVTLFIKTIHALVSVQHESRRVVHCGVSAHPTEEWVAQPLREATPYDEKPKDVMCDHDQKFGADCERVADTSGIDRMPTPYEAPLANAICERFVGSVRRECLDQVWVLGVRQWVRTRTDYSGLGNLDTQQGRLKVIESTHAQTLSTQTES